MRKPARTKILPMEQEECREWMLCNQIEHVQMASERVVSPFTIEKICNETTPIKKSVIMRIYRYKQKYQLD